MRLCVEELANGFAAFCASSCRWQQCLYFLPLPQGHRSLRPVFVTLVCMQDLQIWPKVIYRGIFSKNGKHGLRCPRGLLPKKIRMPLQKLLAATCDLVSP